MALTLLRFSFFFFFVEKGKLRKSAQKSYLPFCVLKLGFMGVLLFALVLLVFSM